MHRRWIRRVEKAFLGRIPGSGGGPNREDAKERDLKWRPCSLGKLQSHIALGRLDLTAQHVNFAKFPRPWLLQEMVPWLAKTTMRLFSALTSVRTERSFAQKRVRSFRSRFVRSGDYNGGACPSIPFQISTVMCVFSVLSLISVDSYWTPNALQVYFCIDKLLLSLRKSTWSPLSPKNS